MKSYRELKLCILESAGFNKGHAYEFVLAAAMVSRFTDRFDDGTPEALTPKSVEDVMKNYFAGKIVWNVDEGDGVSDIVEFDGAGLPKEILNTLSDSKFRKDKVVQQMVKDAIAAVGGSRTLTKLSTEVITNGKSDDVVIKCGGTEGQMSTKSDVDVFVNGREIRKVGISVKYAGTKQAGQFAGVDAAKNLADGFASVGMDITRMTKLRNVRKATESLVGRYSDRKDPIIEKDKAVMFTAVNDLFTGIVKTFGPSYIQKGKNADKIMAGLLKANTGKEDDLEVIRSTVSFDRKTFKAIADFLGDAAKNGNAEWKMETNQNPKIGLYADGTQLFSIRFRYDADPVDKQKSAYRPRFRLYVENGPYLDKLAKSLS